MPDSASRSDRLNAYLPLAFLVMLAGGTDALMFTHSSDLLAVYMTGNSSRLGLFIVQHEWRLAAPLAAVIGTFFLSTTAGAWIGTRAGRWRGPVVLAIAAIPLGAAWFVAREEYSPGTVLCIAVSMGLLNQVLAKEPGVTFITGSLIRLGRAVVDRKVDAILNGATHWIAWIAGAMAGASLDLPFESPALLYLSAGAFAGALISAMWIASRRMATA